MKQRKFRPKQLSFRAALILFCALLATLGMAVGLHARYTSSATASDGARVAKFEIKENGLDQEVLITADLIPGETHTKELTIQNKSEVAVEYTITVSNMTNNLPLFFSVGDDAPADGTYTFTENLLPNSEQKNYILKINWPETLNSTQWMGMVDQVKVSISAIQID